MSTDPLSAEVLDALRELDTPTVCNALEIVAPHRRAYGYTTTPLVCPDPDTVMVGYARTATIRANAPSGRSGEADLAMRVGYYRHMAGGPHPTITVIEDIDAVFSELGFCRLEASGLNRSADPGKQHGMRDGSAQGPLLICNELDRTGRIVLIQG